MSHFRMPTLLGRLQRDERGLTTVEYVIVLCLIAAAAVGSWNAFGDDVKGYLEDASQAIDDEIE